MTPLAYTLTVDDLVYGGQLAMRRQLARKWWKFLAFIVTVSAIVPLLVLVWDGWSTNGWVEGFYILLAVYIPLSIVIWLLLYFWFVRRRARKHFAQMPVLARQQEVCWDNEKLYFANPNGSTRFKMDELHRCCANEETILLYPADHLFYMLPRRIFNSDEQFGDLVNRLKQSGIQWL